MAQPRAKIYEPVLAGILCLNFGVLFFDRNALNFLMPFVQPDLALSNTDVGLLAGAFSLTWAIAGVVVGGISDRTGLRKPILVLLSFGFALCSAWTGLAATLAVLFAARLLMGVLEGGVLPISQALLVREASAKRRGLAMGFMQNFGSNLLGTTAAALILVPLAQSLGWRNAFYIAAIPAAVCGILIWLFVREPARAEETRAAERLPLSGALLDRNILLCVLISILLVSDLVICFAFMPLYLIQSRGFAPDTMSVLVAALGVAASVAGFVVPGISDYTGRKPAMILMPFLGIVVPLSAMFFSGSLTALAVLFFAGWTVIGTFPLFMATIPSETVDPRYMATILGLIMGLGEGVGGVVSPTLAGIAADRFGLDAPMWIMVGLPVAAGLLALGLKETAPRRLGAMRAAA